MKIFDSKNKHSVRTILIYSAIVIATTFIIVWSLPRTESKRYIYDVGKPWMYGSFIAKFDFPIYKTDKAIKEQEDSILKAYQPYYNYDRTVEQEQLKKFWKDIENHKEELTPGSIEIVADLLHRIYQTGIINTSEYKTLATDTTKCIRVVEGNNASSRQVGYLFSTMMAYEQLCADERIVAQRSALQRCNLTNYIEPNLIYDKTRNETEINDLLSSIPPASGMVISGQKIIDRGDLVDEETARVLDSFNREMQRRSASDSQITTTLIGQTFFVVMIIVLLTTYIVLFRRNYFNRMGYVTMLYSLIALFPLAASLFVRNSFFSVYLIPFAMVPIFVRVFMDSRTAFITHVAMTLICTMAVRYQYEFIIIQLIAGLVAIYSLRELVHRSQVFKTAIYVTLAEMSTYFALQMMQDSDLSMIDNSMYKIFLVNGVLLLLSYPLMFAIEKVFGFISNVTLFELSNTNRGLLRDLSENAPGTFQHSIMVGNLAAEIANRIGADSLLVRTGALFHDIGKLSNPVFFTENQAGVNPHDNMTYKESARIVISHVTEGVKMAEREGLPSIIKDFILTHHGTGITRYFYIKYKNEHPDEEVDIAPFQYPGPNPFTREQALLMITDGVEAATRSLSEYTEETISAMVNKIVDTQVSSGYFTECPITFRDITQAKQVLIGRLKAIYHTRISYPELNAPSTQPTKPKKKKKRLSYITRKS